MIRNTILLLALALSTTALPAEEKTPVLQAGAATSNITLPLGARNGGVIARGAVAKQVHDDLHARCLALDDGSTQIAIVVCDLRMIDRGVIEQARALACETTKIPEENILISATHTHAAPGVIGIHTDELGLWYRDFLIHRIADGIVRAHGNLAPARVGWGAGSVPGQVFNRRWHMKEGTIPPNPFDEVGEEVRMNPPRQSPDLVEPAGPTDPELMILSVQHEDGRPLALLANYGVHYVGGYRGGHVSADYFGAFSERMKELLEVHSSDPPFVAIMSNGTSGDTNNNDVRIPRETREPWQKIREVAYEMADEALRVYHNIEHRESISLAAEVADLEFAVRRPDDERIAWAKKTLDPTGIDSATKLNGRAVIYAQEALALADFPPTVPLRLQALRIGDLGITAVPCEVFAETGLTIKEQTPLKATFTIELANGYNGYLPTPQQHEWGGYETWPARSSYLEVEAEPAIRKTLVELLERVAPH